MYVYFIKMYFNIHTLYSDGLFTQRMRNSHKYKAFMFKDVFIKYAYKEGVQFMRKVVPVQGKSDHLANLVSR